MMRRSSALSAAVLCAGALLTSSEALCSDPPGWITPVFNSGAVVTGEAALAPESAQEGVAKAFGYSAPLDGIFSVPPGSSPTEAFSLGLPESVPSQSGARIVETARALGYNWAQCYLFVRNQIRFSPNRGVLRGPERTLLDREGNDADQAFLLLALLRASGYADTAVRYADGVGSSVSMPLGGSAEGYDAASWTGVPSTGTVAEVAGRVANVLNGNAKWTIYTNSTVQASQLRVEHFWVRVRLNSSWYDLDPSFKPRQRTPRSGTLPSDMGYDRARLLQKVGGTARLAHSVSGLDAGRLEGELDRLATNLVERWRSSDRDLPVSAVIGTDETMPQDLAKDPSVFHGTSCTTNGGASVDFLAQTDAFKNALRYALRLEHAGFTNTFWLDEVNTRRLWLSYTNSCQAFPRAVLHVGDGTWAAEPAGGSVADDPLTIRVAFPAAFHFTNTATYALSRSTNNVYAVPVGFGADHRGGMRDLAQQELNRSLGADASAQGPGVRSRVLQVIGQQWHAQTTMMGELIGLLGGNRSQALYRIGISGQAGSPFVDMKNIIIRDYDRRTTELTIGPADLFDSALEHAVLDQVHGTNCAAVSTVRLISLANANADDIFLARSNNWPVVANYLTNYSDSVRLYLKYQTDKGLKVLLPRKGQIALNNWSGYGYMAYGYWVVNVATTNFSTYMAIGGDLAGGFVSEPVETVPAVLQVLFYGLSMPDLTVPAYTSADPVDVRSGAFLSRQTDLALSGPLPVELTRNYDSRLSAFDGPFGKGWSHNFDARVSVRTDPDSLMGRGTPAACAASVVACMVADDLIRAGESVTNLTLACMVAKWWADQLVDGSASVDIGGRPLAFTRAPDGSYLPGPGVTAELSRNADSTFVLKERLGPVWSFNSEGQLGRMDDPSGNYLLCSYNTQTNLVTVNNSFGGTLTFSWTGKHVSSVSDSAGRSVGYRYRADGCLTGVTDAAGYVWRSDYTADRLLRSEADPSGVTVVSNVYNALGQVTNQMSATGHRSVLAYAAGVLATQLDPLGGRTASLFDDDGRLVRRTDPDGGESSFSYDAQGHLVTRVDPLGRVGVSVYDGGNRLVRRIEAANTPDARTNSYAYDSRHRLTAATNALGLVTRMAYDACDRLVAAVAADGATVTRDYDARGLPTLTRAFGASGRMMAAETSAAYDSRGFAVRTASTDAGTVLAAYDNAGNVTNATDALGRSTLIRYDKRGLPTNTVNALGGRTRRTYTPTGRLASETDPLGRTTTHFWTPAGNPAATRYADGGVATNEYDAADRLVAARDPRGSRVALNLDIMGRATNRAASAWADFAWFDAAGCVTARVDAVSGRTVTRYDWLDRPLAVTDPAGRTTGFVYDPLDKVSVKVDPRGRATVYAYDAMGRPTSTAYPSGRSERSGYDALGRAASFVNAEGRVYRMGCDAQGRLLAATNAAGEQVVRNLYDFCGNLTNRTDGAGRNVRYRYDALNRGTNTVYADGSSEVFTYDAVGNLLTACNAAATNTFAYDSMNRLTSAVSRVSGQAFTVRYAYDLGGLATNIVYPDGKSVRYAYDADGRVTNVTDWAGHSFTFTRDAAGRVTSLAYPHVTGTYTYDAGHAVTSWSYGPANAPFAGRTITRDAAGLKTGETATGLLPDPASDRRADNTFDAADRLVSATVVTGSVTFAEAYRYDGCGSLTNVTRSGSAVPQAYAYDLAGRMVSAAATNLSLAVAYDAIGNRVRTVSGGVTRLWVTDHTDPLKRPLMETDAAGAPVRYYLWGGGKFLAVVEADGATHYAHSDELGSVVALTDGDGAVTDRYCYGPYGQDWGHSGTNSIPFRWLGSHGVLAATYLSNSSLLTPHSSLYLTRHRAYDAELGRFISADPSGLGGGPNLYAYGLGNPLAYIDPLGLCGYDQYHSTISADTRPASGYYQKEIMYDPDADPGSRALYHADQLMPEAYVGTEMGDRWVSDRYQTAANIAAAEFVVSEAVGAFATKAFRYVSESEATIAERSGFVPNVTQAGTPKNVFYSPERFTGSSAAEDALRIGSKNPLGPTVAPTHRITVDASGANWGYGGSVEGAPGVELITTKQLRVLSVDPLGR